MATTHELVRKLLADVEELNRKIEEHRWSPNVLGHAHDLLAEIRRTDNVDQWLVAIKAALNKEHRIAARAQK